MSATELPATRCSSWPASPKCQVAKAPKPKTRLAAARDVVLFLVGLAGLIYQSFFVRPLQPLAMAIFAAMVGFPGALSSLTVNVNLPGAHGRDHEL